MKTKALKIINLIVAVLVSVFALGHAFAWLVGNRLESLQDFNGSSGSPYFASGTGAQNDPFIITNQYHMYNLAWLQNTGKFDKQYYFQVGNDISIPENFWLPPIGTDTNPFEGVFNGKGYKITNLQVTTDNSKLTGVVSGTSVKYSNAVGMFGMTDAGADISNFILEKPVVEVANANATYSTAANKVAGLAVGHVAQDSKVYSIGVLADQTGTKLLMNKGGYSTFNSIIGELAEGVESSVTGGGHTSGGSGANFGSSFDVGSMLDRLQLILANKKSATPSPYLPNIDTQSSNPVPVALEKMPFTVTDSSTYVGAEAKEVVANTNVGYFLGNQNKIVSKNLKFGNKLTAANDSWTNWTNEKGNTPATDKTIPRWFYTHKNIWDTSGNDPYSNEGTDYTTGSGFNELSQAEYDALPDSIKNILPAENVSQDSFTTIRISQQYQYQQSAGSQGVGNSGGNWSYHGQISWMGNTYGENYSGTDGKGYQDTSGILLPNNAIWFKPAETGKFRLVMYTDTAGDGFVLIKATRTNGSANEPFKNDSSSNGTDITFTTVMKQQLPSYVLFYYEYEVTQDELDAGNVEYFLMQHGNGGAYFVYLDIGSSGMTGDTGEIDHEKAVSAVDFIYSGVSIAQADEKPENPAYHMGDFIVTSSATLYEATGTSIYFDKLDTILEIIFLRKSVNEDKTMQVTVTGTTDDTKVTATNTGKVEFVFNES